MPTTYEWDVETIDPESGDILNHNFNDALRPLLPTYLPEDPTLRLVLVRNVGNDVEGLTDRLWAYVDDNWNLPKHFEGAGEVETAVKVPKRFHREIARAAK